MRNGKRGTHRHGEDACRCIVEVEDGEEGTLLGGFYRLGGVVLVPGFRRGFWEIADDRLVRLRGLALLDPALGQTHPYPFLRICYPCASPQMGWLALARC